MAKEQTGDNMESEATRTNLMNKISSRKFLACVIAILVNAYLAHSGSIETKLCMDNIIWLVGIFVIGEAFVDGKRVGNGGGSKPFRIAELVSQVVGIVKKKDGGDE